MRNARLLFSVVAAFPLIVSFCVYTSHFDTSNLSVLTGTATLIVYLFLVDYSKRVSKIVTVAFYGPVLFAVSILILYGDAFPIASLGVGYLLAVPILMFLSGLSESPRGTLTIYFFAYLTSLLILAAVMSGATTPQSLFVWLVESFVGILSVRAVPFYPVAGFGFLWQLLAVPTALGAVGLAFLAASSPKGFTSTLQDYAGMVKAVLASMVFTFIIAILSVGSPSIVSLLIEASALALLIIVFKVSRRA